MTIDWTLRENVCARLRVLVRRILRRHGYPPDKQEKATLTVLEQAEIWQTAPVSKTARSAMNAYRAMSLYIDLEAVADLFSDLSGSGADVLSEVTGIDLTPGVDAASDFNTPNWLAVSAGFIDRGIVINAITPFGSDFLGGFALADDPAKLLPDDTLFLGAASSEPNMDKWRAELEKYTVADLIGPETADDMIEEMTGMVSDDFEGYLDPIPRWPKCWTRPST